MSEVLSPKALSDEGQQKYSQGEYLAAAHLFQAASLGYKAEADELSAAEQQNNSCVAYLQAGQPKNALEICTGTDMIFAQAGDIRRQGMALGNLASAMEALGKNDEALNIYEEASELLKKAGEDQLRANVLQSISRLQLKTGHQLEALATMQAGIEGLKRPSLRQRLLKKVLNLPNKWLNIDQ